MYQVVVHKKREVFQHRQNQYRHSWMREEGIDANSFIGMPHFWNRRTYLRTVLRDSSKLLLICFISIPNA